MSWFNRKPRPKNPPLNFSSKIYHPATQVNFIEIKTQFKESKMINERKLQNMYQQWLNGRDNAALDWSYFVEFAAKETEIPANEMASLLQRCHWFYWTTEDK